MSGMARQQREQRFRPVGRSFRPDPVLEQGFARAFPLPNDSAFDDLLVAIDLAESKLPNRR
jgi:hypothetical protein